MKTEDLIALGIAAFAVYLLMAKPAAAGGAGKGTAFTGAEITNAADPGEPGWGWKYFTDGTAISPEGIYFKNGVRVWSPF